MTDIILWKYLESRGASNTIIILLCDNIAMPCDVKLRHQTVNLDHWSFYDLNDR
jgi:hypothetical protein